MTVMRTLDHKWTAITDHLNTSGWATIPGLIPDAMCDELAGVYDQDECFRTRIVMSRHGFGRGEYKYFAYPLPEVIQNLRSKLYRHLVPTANAWNAELGSGIRYPSEHEDFLARCHEAGQRRPTPLLLRYEAGDYNCLHQDLYGEHQFPFQVAILLSDPRG